jgi:hypothetical protein
MQFLRVAPAHKGYAFDLAREYLTPAGWVIFDVTAKGTLLPLFLGIAAAKLTYVFGVFVLNKIPDK